MNELEDDYGKYWSYWGIKESYSHPYFQTSNFFDYEGLYPLEYQQRQLMTFNHSYQNRCHIKGLFS